MRKKGTGFLKISLSALLIFLMSGCSVIDFSNLFGTPDRDKALLKETEEIKEFISRVRPWPGNPRSHYLLACNYLRAGKSDDAVREFRKTILIDPLSAEAYNGLGMAHDQKGEYEKAAEFYRTAIKINPGLPYLHNNLGYSYTLQGKYELAIESFTRAIALNVKGQTARNNMALAHALAGRSDLDLREKPAETAGDVLPAGAEDAGKEEGPRDSISEALQGIEAASTMKALVRAEEKMEQKKGPPARRSNTGAANPAIGIEVSNGNGINGMAKMVSLFLKDKGFKVGRLTNAGDFNFKKTRVYYRPGNGELAAKISKDLPGLHLARETGHFDREQIKIKIVIGKDLVPYKEMLDRKAGRNS